MYATTNPKCLSGAQVQLHTRSLKLAAGPGPSSSRGAGGPQSSSRGAERSSSRGAGPSSTRTGPWGGHFAQHQVDMCEETELWGARGWGAAGRAVVSGACVGLVGVCW